MNSKSYLVQFSACTGLSLHTFRMCEYLQKFKYLAATPIFLLNTKRLIKLQGHVFNDEGDFPKLKKYEFYR